MKNILRWKWLVIVVWIVAVAGLTVTAPDMAQLVREKGQITVPDGASSHMAAKLLDEMNTGKPEGDDELSAVLVFHNDKGMTASDNEEMEHAVRLLKDGKDTYGIASVTTHFDMVELESQMVAEDGKTVLMLVTVSLDGRTEAEAGNALYEAISDVNVDHYYTGSWMISEDVIKSSQEGLKKTEWLTFVFILGILLLVFRSVVAPLIPLVTVGISYIAAQSVVAFLVKTWDFPLSNFTQIFLVAVMFGIGTDYCILLISRFKEELVQRGDKTEAILATYKTAGRTVLFSGMAVLVGFASIGLSTFVLYRSAAAVAIGVAVLLIALATIVPFFMAVLGKAIFWPSRGSLEHKESKLWGAMGRFSLKRPVWALIVLAVLIVPFFAAYKGSTSFNSLDEIGDKYNSVKAFEIIADSFGPGDSLPSTVVVKSDQPFDSPEGLAALEQITRELANVEGVKTVRSATRPTGEPLKDFQVSNQVQQLDDGLGQGGDGLNQIAKGLTDASSALSSNAPKLNDAAQGAELLTEGTIQLKEGVVQLGEGLKQLEKGLRDGSKGAGELADGLQQAKASAEQLAKASSGLLGHYKEMGDGLAMLSKAYGDVAIQQAAIAQGLSDLGTGLNGLSVKYPELAQDPDYLKIQGTVAALQTGSSELAAGMNELNSELAGVSQGMAQANAGFERASGGQSALAQGLASLADGIGKLQAGIEQAADGQGQIVARIPEITEGFDQVTEGQQGLQAGFAQLHDQLGELTTGLNQSVDGLTQVTGGLSSAQSYLNELAGSKMAGWFVPKEALGNEDFLTAIDAYLSGDRKIAKFDVVFDGNPYEIETMDKVSGLEEAVGRALAGTSFEDANYAVSGITSINNDLRNISASDYSRTVVLMLIGLMIVLVFLFRSIVMPLYLIASLLLTFHASMAITEVIFVRILGNSGISWAVPFFGFVMLMALGIDYSIFLMDRFKEYRQLPPREGILKAMKNMGTVIGSAAVILGGTFAAMLPAGVMSLLQIATLMLCGLFLYALVILPLFVPVMVRIFGPANWWPFMDRGETAYGSVYDAHDAAPKAASVPMHESRATSI